MFGWWCLFSFFVLLFSIEIIDSYVSTEHQSFWAVVSVLLMIILSQVLFRLSPEQKRKTVLLLQLTSTILVLHFIVYFWPNVISNFWLYLASIFGIKGF